jgi:hypothetical protein
MSQEGDMAFSSIVFQKFTFVDEFAFIDKNIDVDSFVFFNTSMADANAHAMGTWTHAQTLTEAITVQGVGSEAGSQSVAASQPSFPIVPFDLI